MKIGFQPYGRVSSRGDQRRAVGWNLRVAIFMGVILVLCLIVVLYEFLYLQAYAASGVAVDVPVEEHDVHLRSNQEMDSLAVVQATKSRSVVTGRKTIILVANYRDSTRCSEMLRSIFDNAVAPDDIKISIYDQIYPKKKELPCSEEFCKLVGEEWCRRSQIVSSQIDAANATGPTTARYETVKAVTDEDFCMAIDSHLVFVPKWDEKIIAQWDSLENPNAIISVYPKSMTHIKHHDDKLHFMCTSRIETEDPDSMVQYTTPIWIYKADMPKPRLSSQLAGGFNFGGCKETKEVRDDPYTPYLFHGEEYSRAARLWTNGYDFYAPSEDIVFHWYEKRKVVWERDWSERYLLQQMSRRRARYSLQLPVTKEDFDHTDLQNFTLGTKRTFEQWKNFSGIDPLAKFISDDVDQFDNCHELEKCILGPVQSCDDHQLGFDNMESMLNLQYMALALALLAYVRKTWRSLRQQYALLQQNEPRLPWSDQVRATLRYTFIGQLIASLEYLLCLVKPQLSTRIGRLLLWTPQDCRANCRYGSHERNVLDVYGVQEGKAKPVLVFMHGGAWTFGHKWQYALVGEYLATQGFLVVVMGYRTLPIGSVVDMIEDVENAVFWAAENCHALGGDPSKLYLSGHSSGGHIGSLALVKSALRLADNNKKEKEIGNYVKGFIGLGAPYDVSDHYIYESERIVGPFNGIHEISAMKPAMLGVSNFKKYSATALIEESQNIAFSLPTFYLLHGDNDTAVPLSSAKKLASSLKKAGQNAVYCEVADCTHEDIVLAMMGDTVGCRVEIVKLLKWITMEPTSTADTPQAE